MSKEIFRAIIIDDEQHCIETLRYELGMHCQEIEVISSHRDTLGGIKAINDLHPDIVFLDIELSDTSGFEFLESLSYRNFHLIFTTAYNQYAVDALRISAFDYLMKPVSGKDLRLSIDRLISEHGLKRKSEGDKSISTEPVRVVFPAGNTSLILVPNDIIRVQADGNFSMVYMDDLQEHYISKSLKEVEETLPSPSFTRVHKSHLVNVKKIIAYHKSEGGRLEMSDGSKLPVTKVTISEIIGYIT